MKVKERHVIVAMSGNKDKRLRETWLKYQQVSTWAIK